MFSLLKFAFYFTVSFFILSIPVKKKPLFDHLYQAAAPHRAKLQYIGTESLKEGKEIGEKLFNSAPVATIDSIKSQLSSTKKVRAPAIEVENKKPFGEYTEEEEAMLKKIMAESKE